MTFDPHILNSLPLPDEEGVERVRRILQGLVTRRLLPYFKTHRGTDPRTAGRVAEKLDIRRFEDEGSRVRAVSFLTGGADSWTIHVHERIFDYLAFVLPSDPESRLGEGTTEERKMLAFAEFFLRHELEHALYPELSERNAIRGDLAFALVRRQEHPTYYQDLRRVLSDEMNGLQGEPFLTLFDFAEQDLPTEEPISRIYDQGVGIAAGFPGEVLTTAFPHFDRDLKTRVLGECCRRSRDTAHPLIRRSAFLEKLLRLFALEMERDPEGSREIFEAYKERWGLAYLFQELELPESTVETKDKGDVFRKFRDGVQRFINRLEGTSPVLFRKPAGEVAEAKLTPPPTRSLKDRIEDARNDPRFPPQVIELIEKNKLNAVGHSGAKYSELIETLLAIPWKRIQPITVTPEDFERCLNRTHYGLQRPKEMLCDFFTNLIWRYRRFRPEDAGGWQRTGSSFLFVGPPGVGKTSLAISIAANLEIPWHKLSLGGMRDESDLRGHGFTYEGSKPGAIVQGLIKMGVTNGMFIMDEADKTEAFAIATLLEILDPEQNHLFHDKYTQSTVDIDLSNCHFVLTANTLETVPPPVVNRCEVVHLDRYSVEEKVAIAREHLVGRVRRQYEIGESLIVLDPEEETELLRYLVRTYTYEAGVRELERILRTLFLRILRKDVLSGGPVPVVVTREKIKRTLDTPRRPWKINEEDRVGEAMAIGVNVERGVGNLIPVQATQVRFETAEAFHPEAYMSMVHATGNIEKVMDESRRVATTGILHCAAELGIDVNRIGVPTHLHFMGASTPKDGPSAGGAIALALASLLTGRKIRRDVAMTGEIDTQGRITRIGGLDVKLETAADAGCRTLIIPKDNLLGNEGIERLPDALKKELQVLTYEEWRGDHPPLDVERHELQVVAVDHITQAADVAFIYEEELQPLEELFVPHGRRLAAYLEKAAGQAPSFVILCVKTAEEVDAETAAVLRGREARSLILAWPAAVETLRRRLQDSATPLQVLPFNPKTDSFSEAALRAGTSLHRPSAGPLRLTVSAPYFFLTREGILTPADTSTLETVFQEIRLFANNYTLQGAKIKGSKALLHRVAVLLAGASAELVETCPFLARLEGGRCACHVVDLGFIPEKYRLDIRRAESILAAAARRWMNGGAGKPLRPH